MIKKSYFEDAADRLGIPFDREHFSRVTQIQQPPKCRLKPGNLGRVHISNERQNRYPDLYNQDGPTKGSPARRHRSGMVSYIGPFGLMMFARDTARYWAVPHNPADTMGLVA